MKPILRKKNVKKKINNHNLAIFSSKHAPSTSSTSDFHASSTFSSSTSSDLDRSETKMKDRSRSRSRSETRNAFAREGGVCMTGVVYLGGGAREACAQIRRSGVRLRFQRSSSLLLVHDGSCWWRWLSWGSRWLRLGERGGCSPP